MGLGALVGHVAEPQADREDLKKHAEAALRDELLAAFDVQKLELCVAFDDHKEKVRDACTKLSAALDTQREEVKDLGQHLYVCIAQVRSDLDSMYASGQASAALRPPLAPSPPPPPPPPPDPPPI